MNEREQKITNVLETYFSDACLLWDKVMLNKLTLDSNQMVSFEELSQMQKLKALNATPQELLQYTEKHSLTRLKLSQDKTKVGRIKPFIVNKKEELDDWSIYVEGLSKPYTDEQSIRELFNQLIGHVSFFRIPMNQQFYGYCFLEFDDKQNVQKAVDLLNSYPKRKTSDNKLVNQLNLRVMTKLDWLKLKDEYLELLADRKKVVKSYWDEHYSQETFTKGVIVFVDNLHPSSSKTTSIRLLETSGVKIAFMNPKKKGLSSTHIRLDTPQDAIKICDYFTTNPTVQETDKDAIGKKAEANCLKMRIISGTEEKIYWENDKKP